MHDNALVHTASIIQELLASLGVDLMVWPPYSPDLNPIKNIWALMKAIIYERYPKLEKASDNEETLQNLIEVAKEAWHAIDERVLRHLCESMPHRVQAVLTADGLECHSGREGKGIEHPGPNPLRVGSDTKMAGINY